MIIKLRKYLSGINSRSLILDNLNKKRVGNYYDYLNSNKSKMTDAVADFFLPDWHYDPRDHKCLHDSWLEKINIFEIPLDPEDVSNLRKVNMELKLLGAYHDLYIIINYFDVSAYSFNQPKRTGSFPPPQVGHSDWLTDELNVIDKNNYFHKIVWASEAEWIIQFKDLSFSFEEIKE